MTFADWPELIGTAVGFLLTIIVLSYLIGDNPLFRLAIHLFIGVSAGFVAAVILRNVIFPNLIQPLFTLASGEVSFENALVLVPVILSLLLLTKLSANLGRAGNLPMAFLVGVGAAVAIGGAVTGTLFPQAETSMNVLDLSQVDFRDPAAGLSEVVLARLVVFVGTLSTFIFFHFGTRPAPEGPPARSPWIESIARIGQGFIAVTFGVMFAGVYMAALTALIERLYFLWAFVTSFF